MKLPSIQRFQKQDYPGSPDWFTRFLSDLNSFTEIVWNILNNNVTPGDNLDSQVYSFAITAGAAASDNTTSFQLMMNHNPSVMLVGNVVDQAAYAAPLTTAVGLQWIQSGTTISITAITGLVADETYTITIVLL